MKFETIKRIDFLNKRKRETEEALDYKKNNPDFPIIIMDAGEEIVCDVCNSLVEDELLYINSYGLYCEACRK